jgi:hypothetical protein
VTSHSSVQGILLASILAAGAALAAAQQPAWIIQAPARRVLSALWRASVTARAERVACLSGRIRGDSVWITGAAPVVTAGADSLAAEGEPSLAQCGPPQWIGTVHTHVRSTDDAEPADRFSPGDRAQMSEWARRWSRAGAFCLLHSAQAAHCEIYPWRRQPPRLPPPNP